MTDTNTLTPTDAEIDALLRHFYESDEAAEMAKHDDRLTARAVLAKWGAQPAALATPTQAGWCDDCNPDNCSGCATPAAPVDADVQKQDEALIWLMLAALQYHTEQTRPIRRTDDAITAARRRLESKP